MVKIILILGFSFLQLIYHVNSQNLKPNFSHKLELDKGIQIKWTSDDPIWITIEMYAPTNGYVAIGFSPNGGMRGSDIVMGWVDENGKGHIKDLYATGNQTPREDAVQNYELLNAVASENRTTILFRRKWTTCDVDHDFVIGDDTVRIIWAYNDKKPSLDTFKPMYHDEFRGVRRTHFREPQTGFRDLGPNVKHLDLYMENNTVSGEDDVFFCKIAKVDKLDKKHHIIGFQPLLEKGNEFNIHHMFLYECVVPSSDGGTEKLFEEHASSNGGRCYTPNMPPSWSRYCVNTPFLWTSGSEGSLFPENVGLPLGEEYGGATYFMFEIHYDNPYFRTFTDSSGFRILYTDQLRPNDVGVISIGHKISPFETVPPSMPSFTGIGFCTSECTNQVLPSEGINAIAVLLHAHQAGRKLILRHIRNGKELPPLAKDDSYDYNYQQARALQPERKILPGDELVAECQYDTSLRKTPAFGGVGTRDEMCMAFFYYYPRTQLADCRSQPEFHSYLNALGINKVEGEILKEMKMPYVPEENQQIEYPDNPFYLKNSTYENLLFAFDAMNIVDGEGSGTTVGDRIRNIEWSSVGKSVEKKWLEGKHYAFCSGPDRKRHALKDYIVSQPKFESYVAPKGEGCEPVVPTKFNL